LITIYRANYKKYKVSHGTQKERDSSLRPYVFITINEFSQYWNILFKISNSLVDNRRFQRPGFGPELRAHDRAEVRLNWFSVILVTLVRWYALPLNSYSLNCRN